MYKNITFIGKVSSFQNGYIFVKFNYTNFLKVANLISLGDYLFVSALNEENYILGQIVDIYDSIMFENEQNIRSMIANNGDITSTEKDIYLYVELKIKPVAQLNKDGKIIKDIPLTILLRDVFVFNEKSKVQTDIILNNFFDLNKNSKKNKFNSLDEIIKDDPLGFLNSLFEYNNISQIENKNSKVVFLINCNFLGTFNKEINLNEEAKKYGFSFIQEEDLLEKDQKIKINETTEKIIFLTNSKGFLNFFQDNLFFNPNIIFLLKINTRSDLEKISSLYLNPSIIIGKNLLKTDYEILKNIVNLKNDYLDIFSSSFFVIFKNILFHW